MKYTLLLCAVIILIFSCKEDKQQRQQVLLLSVRDKDTLHVKLINKTTDTIYVPSDYWGIYSAKQDTIFLETVDKPEYGKDSIYGYSKIFPFEFYVAKKFKWEEPDTILQTVRQVYYFNQFLVQPFEAIYPDSSFFTSLNFYVPGNARTVRAVYYTVPFLKNNQKGPIADYTIKDWVSFDSLYAKYTVTEVLDRVYLE